MATVVLLVLLRLCLGCHFFYEGVWKIKHPEFSAAPLLKQAKGPAAGLFHAMVPDLEGRERLKVERVVVHEGLLDAWRKVRDDDKRGALKRYRDRVSKPYKDRLAESGRKDLNGLELLAIEKKVEQMRIAVSQVLWKSEDKLEDFLRNHETAILDYLETRSKETSADRIKALDKKAAAWLTEFGKLQDEYAKGLEKLAAKDEDSRVAIMDPVRKLTPIFPKGAKVEDQLADNRLLDAERHVILKIDRRILADKFYQPWKTLKQKVIAKFKLNEEQKLDAEIIYRRYKDAARAMLNENRADIETYFAALERFDRMEEAGNRGAAHQKERFHTRREELRGEVDVWLTGLQKADRGYQDALAGLLTKKQAAQGKLPVPWTRMGVIDFLMVFSLTAIGACLLLGLFTRPAALGGAAFMLSVVLVQPAWPTLYPPSPAVVGHALLINKDFLEMVALLMLATTAAGRWGGLDYFVENFIIFLWKSREKQTGYKPQKGGK